MTFAAVVLAGGAARRLDGVRKPLLTIEGTALVGRVLAAVATADPRVVVGPAELHDALPTGVAVTSERPPGGGPLAALRAGLALVPVTIPAVAVLAADLPFVTADVIGTLRTALDDGEAEVALLLDASGRRQNLLGVWRAEPLRAALSHTSGSAIRDLLTRVRVAEVPPPAASLPAWLDCDTAGDLALARRLARIDPSLDQGSARS